MPIVRNDIPDVFWQSVEPYCADITEEDIKMLENQIEIQDNYMSSFKSDFCQIQIKINVNLIGSFCLIKAFLLWENIMPCNGLRKI